MSDDALNPPPNNAGKTATQLLDEGRNGEYVFTQRYEAFLRRWEPTELHQRHAFHADMIGLVHALHAEAARPYQHLVKDAFNLSSIFPIGG